MKAYFASAEIGFRLHVHYAPPHGVAQQGGILHVHAFGEEMNKSRNVVARQARALAARGWHVLLIDLLGCGDSSGDFGDATWENWLTDLDDAVARLRHECDERICLWGLRAGALLAADWVQKRKSSFPLLFWHPVLNGRQYVQQLLRLRIAGHLVGKGERREFATTLRTQLDEQGSLEIAGYAISAPLVRGLERCEIAQLPAGSRMIWMETSTRQDPTLTPASLACVDRLRAIGCEVTARAVSGPPFWGSSYLEECPALIDASTDALAAARFWVPAADGAEQSPVTSR